MHSITHQLWSYDGVRRFSSCLSYLVTKNVPRQGRGTTAGTGPKAREQHFLLGLPGKAALPSQLSAPFQPSHLTGEAHPQSANGGFCLPTVLIWPPGTSLSEVLSPQSYCSEATGQVYSHKESLPV